MSSMGKPWPQRSRGRGVAGGGEGEGEGEGGGETGGGGGGEGGETGSYDINRRRCPTRNWLEHHFVYVWTVDRIVRVGSSIPQKSEIDHENLSEQENDFAR